MVALRLPPVLDANGCLVGENDIVKAQIPRFVSCKTKVVPWELCTVVNVFYKNGTPCLALDCAGIWHSRKASDVIRVGEVSEGT